MLYNYNVLLHIIIVFVTTENYCGFGMLQLEQSLYVLENPDVAYTTPHQNLIDCGAPSKEFC